MVGAAGGVAEEGAEEGAGEGAAEDGTAPRPGGMGLAGRRSQSWGGRIRFNSPVGNVSGSSRMTR